MLPCAGMQSWTRRATQRCAPVRAPSAPPHPRIPAQAMAPNWSDRFMMADGLHFSEDGNAMVARAVNDFIWARVPSARCARPASRRARRAAEPRRQGPRPGSRLRPRPSRRSTCAAPPAPRALLSPLALHRTESLLFHHPSWEELDYSNYPAQLDAERRAAGAA